MRRRRRRIIDLLLALVVAALVVTVAVDALLPRGHGLRAPTAAAPARAPVPPPADAPVRVSLHSSPDMAFLPDCRRSRATLAIDSRRRRLVFRRAGGRCHLPPLQFVATVRTPSGRLLYRGPAVAGRGLAGANLTGDAVLSAPLLPGLLQCDVQGPVLVVVRGHGLAAAGATHCRGSR